MLNAVRIPAGVDDATVRSGLLDRFGIEIGGGLGDFKGKVWRIGLMGYGSRARQRAAVLLAAPGAAAGRAESPFDHGRSIAAATSRTPTEVSCTLVERVYCGSGFRPRAVRPLSAARVAEPQLLRPARTVQRAVLGGVLLNCAIFSPAGDSPAFRSAPIPSRSACPACV